MSFQVQTTSFEGPFDLLLHLILKDDVDLYEIRLGDIVDAYLAEISAIETCDLEVSTEFLLIAATLVELKCRRLLPVDDDLDLDEELGLWEERDLLLARLFECKTFKDAATTLHEMMTDAAQSVPRQFGLEDQFLELAPDPLAGMTAQKLRRAFLRQMAEKPKGEELTLMHVMNVKASVTDAIEQFLQDLPRRGPVTFRELTDGIEERLEVVVRFLAVLELFKQGLIEIDQAACFGELVVTWAPEDGGDTTHDAMRGFTTVAELALSSVDSYEG